MVFSLFAYVHVIVVVDICHKTTMESGLRVGPSRDWGPSCTAPLDYHRWFTDWAGVPHRVVRSQQKPHGWAATMCAAQVVPHAFC